MKEKLDIISLFGKISELIVIVWMLSIFLELKGMNFFSDYMYVGIVGLLYSIFYNYIYKSKNYRKTIIYGIIFLLVISLLSESKMYIFFIDSILPYVALVFGVWHLYSWIIDIWANKISTYAKNGNNHLALKNINIISKFPLNKNIRSWVIYISGHLFFEQGKFNKTLHYLEKGIEYNNKYPWYYILHGRICIAERRIDEAIEYLMKSLSLNPNENAAIGDLVYCYTFKSDIDNAIKYHEKLNKGPKTESEEFVNQLRKKMEEELFEEN